MTTDCQIFVSVGATANQAQEAFVCVQNRLRAEGLSPHTVSRNTFTSGSPIEAVTELIKSCSGAVVIAFEEGFPEGIEK